MKPNYSHSLVSQVSCSLRDLIRYVFCAASRIKAYYLTSKVGWFGDNSKQLLTHQLLCVKKVTETRATYLCTYATDNKHCKIRHLLKFRSKIWKVGTFNQRAKPHLQRVALIIEWRIHGHFFLSTRFRITNMLTHGSSCNNIDLFFFQLHFSSLV